MQAKICQGEVDAFKIFIIRLDEKGQFLTPGSF